MLRLVLLQICDTFSVFCLLLMANQMVLGRREIITHFLQLFYKLLLFLQQGLLDKIWKKKQVNAYFHKQPIKVFSYNQTSQLNKYQNKEEENN